jgi:hypothetical protein
MLGLAAAEKSRTQTPEYIWIFVVDLDFAPHALAHATAESDVELCEPLLCCLIEAENGRRECCERPMSRGVNGTTSSVPLDWHDEQESVLDSGDVLIEHCRELLSLGRINNFEILPRILRRMPLIPALSAVLPHLAKVPLMSALKTPLQILSNDLALCRVRRTAARVAAELLAVWGRRECESQALELYHIHGLGYGGGRRSTVSDEARNVPLVFA